jgi:hypothetical protein
MHHAPAIVGEEHQDEQQPARRCGHDQESAAISWCTWFAKKVRQFCEGDPWWRTMYFATVVWETVRPSFSNSP